MMIVGLTGGIGSGKTTVGSLFAELGVPVYNSDEEAKKLMQSSKKIRRAITQLLGKEAYNGGKLNRPYIAKKVFNDKELLQKINAIVHPEVKKDFSSWAEKQEKPYVIQEAAILFENGSYKNYDRMILVKAPKALRIARLKKRDNSTEKDILERMRNQWSDAKKSRLSDFVINNKSLDKTKAAIVQIHGELLKTSG